MSLIFCGFVLCAHVRSCVLTQPPTSIVSPWQRPQASAPPCVGPAAAPRCESSGIQHRHDRRPVRRHPHPLLVCACRPSCRHTLKSTRCLLPQVPERAGDEHAIVGGATRSGGCREDPGAYTALLRCCNRAPGASSTGASSTGASSTGGTAAVAARASARRTPATKRRKGRSEA